MFDFLKLWKGKIPNSVFWSFTMSQFQMSTEKENGLCESIQKILYPQDMPHEKGRHIHILFTFKIFLNFLFFC